VQHDGGGWRCLVACALAAILERFFQVDLSPYQPARSDERGASQVGQQWHLFPLRMHGRYEPAAGTAVSRAIPSAALLAQTSPKQMMTSFISISK